MRIKEQEDDKPLKIMVILSPTAMYHCQIAYVYVHQIKVSIWLIQSSMEQE